MKRILPAFLLLLPACAGGAFRSAATTPAEALQCGMAEAAALGYTAATIGDPRDPHTNVLVLRRSFPPRESVHRSTGYLTIHAFARPDGTRLSVEAERYEDRGGAPVDGFVPDLGVAGPGGTETSAGPFATPQRRRSEARGGKRVSAGPAAWDAQRIREACAAAS